jgi:hypothetical protein
VSGQIHKQDNSNCHYLNYVFQKFRGVASSADLEGTVLYLLNPQVTSDPQRPETLLFKVSRQQDIVVLGKCPTFSKCDGVRKDGKACTMPVDISETTRCKYHKERSQAQLDRHNMPPSAVPPKPKPKPSLSATTVNSSSETLSLITPVDYLQQALKPDTSRRVASNQPAVTHKFSAVCPLDENDDDDDEDDNDTASQKVLGLHKPTTLGKQDKSSGSGRSAATIDRKDGSVTIPKESVVFKTLSETYYNRRAQENKLRATASALQQTTSSSQAPVTSAAMASSNGLLSSRHTGATRHNNLVAQSEKRKLDQSVFDKIHNFSKLRCVGGDLFDIDQARKNANKVSVKKAADQLKSAQQTSQKQLDVDIEALLSRESSHSAEAEDDAFKAQMTRLETLSKREYMVQKDEKVQSLTVRAYQCTACNELSESPLERCRKQGHPVNTVSVLKRFYECVNCEKRESTLGGSVRLPKHACLRCSEYKWRACGKRKTGNETSSRVTAAERLVVSMAEGTGRRDVDRVAGAKAALDHMQ